MVELKLLFKTEDDRDFFIADLLDGRGENMAHYKQVDPDLGWEAGIVVERFDADEGY